MTLEGSGCPPVRNSNGRMRRIARLALPTGAALGAGAAIAAVAAGQDPVSAPTTTNAAAITQAAFPRATSDYFLEIDGIKGESTADKYAGAIDVDYFSFGDGSVAPQVRFGSGAGAGRVRFDEFTFKKGIDSASPQLFQDSVTGQHLQKAVLFAVKPGEAQQQYLKVTLSNVVVSSYRVASQHPDGEGEVETVTLDFQKIDYQYTPQNRDGSSGAPITAGWDLSANKRS
jgi:type VI secretion system secreted protein Hcp